MKPYLACLMFFALSAISCGGGSSGPDATQTEFLRSDVDLWPNHRYFPLTPGTQWIYEGEKDGQPTREEVRVLEDMREIWGTRCAVIQEHIIVAGHLAEMTWELFGLDSAGNVWKFGEESYELEDGELKRTADSWFAGDGDGLPWIAFAADLKIGDRFAGYTPSGIDKFRVSSLSATESLPNRSFSDCLELVENEEDADDMDIILYAPGVGRVTETNASGRLELIEMRRVLPWQPGRGNRVVRNNEPDPLSPESR